MISLFWSSTTQSMTQLPSVELYIYAHPCILFISYKSSFLLLLPLPLFTKYQNVGNNNNNRTSLLSQSLFWNVRRLKFWSIFDSVSKDLESWTIYIFENIAGSLMYYHNGLGRPRYFQNMSIYRRLIGSGQPSHDILNFELNINVSFIRLLYKLI